MIDIKQYNSYLHGVDRAEERIKHMELSLKPKHVFVIGDIFPFSTLSRKKLIFERI